MLDEQALLEFITAELKTRHQDTVKDYLIINTKIQKELENSEKEKSEMLIRIRDYEKRLESANTTLKVVQDEYFMLEKTYKNTIMDYENNVEQLRDLETQHNQLRNRYAEAEKELRSKLIGEREESDKKVRDLTKNLVEVQKERGGLLNRVKDALNSRTSNEEYQNHQKNQLNELTIKYSQTCDENDKLRRRLEATLEEKKTTALALEKKTKEFDELKSDVLLEKEKLITMYESRMKQKEQEMLTRQRGTTLNRETRFTQLGALNMLEQDLYNQSFNNFPIRNSNTQMDKVYIPISDRNMPPLSIHYGDEFAPPVAFQIPSEQTYSYNDVMNDINYLVK